MTRRWYVTRYLYDNPAIDDGRDNDCIWTVSLQPDKEGWETDCATGGYGLPKAAAQELADAANIIHELKTRLRS